ncbi:FecR family protein [Sphingobacterium sp. GVS05A]|uniref:FecR family protein n=1 Tax=Sphingobacterium TaxID=28453 RepID=UPI001CBC92DC|nr:FecR domain-containing protein [Sphingobacterium sp. GVS05A]
MNRKQLLNKFLANQCSAEEAKLVFSWLNENPKLLDDLISEDDWTSYIAQEKNVKRRNGNISKIFTVFVVFGLLFFCSNLFEERQGQIAQEIIRKTYYNPLSRPKEIITDDESHLVLAPGALVQVRIKSNLDFRYVKVLEGKVQFKVAKDPSKPFIVESDQLTTTALGTQFIVNYTSRSKDVLVQLLEGKVRVAHVMQSAEHVKILKPGQQIYFSAASQMVLSDFGNTSKGADRVVNFLPQLIGTAKEKEYSYPMTIHQSANWLEMEQTSLSEIIQYINHELDMPVSYDSLLVRNYRLKGRFRRNAAMDLQDKTQLAESILQLIVEVNPFKLEKQQNTYILKPKK